MTDKTYTIEFVEIDNVSGEMYSRKYTVDSKNVFYGTAELIDWINGGKDND